jgi:predicted glycoside hydrolase/deacetylase ChbG (UPF0249 family)
MKNSLLIPSLLLWPLLANSLAAQSVPQSKIRLLACGDDIGVAQAFLDGAIQGYKDGILRCINVVVPGPWFPDAVRRLNEMPDIGVGLHLALTSEWDGMKYRPLTFAPTLTDENGYLFPSGPAMLNNRRPGGGKQGPDMAEVEKEFRAQIEMIKRRIPRVSWIWPHMAVATSTPELRALTERLAREYDLPLLGVHPGIKMLKAPGLATQASDNATKASTIVRLLTDLQPGTYYFITHPSLDTPEVRALGHKGTENLAAHRLADLQQILTNPEAMGIVKRRGIELMGPEQAVRALHYGKNDDTP